MRITAKAKAETRVRILEAADNLFKINGFSQTTTRDIARATGLATGTLFNYFATKEELALTLVGARLREAGAEFQKRRSGGESLEELLFAQVASALRHLGGQRGYAEPVLRATAGGESEGIRAGHVEAVAQLIEAYDGPPSALDLHLYWTLFLGVLNFWASDGSPHQEDTLALLDQSMKLFVESLAGRQERSLEVNNGPISG